MADYQAKINLLVSGQAQLKALTTQLKQASQEADRLNTRTEAIRALSRRTEQILKTTGREQPRTKGGRFAKDPDRQTRLNALRQERANKRELFTSRRRLALQELSVSSVQKEVSNREKLNRVVANQLNTEIQLDKTAELFETRVAKFQRGRPTATKATEAEVNRIRNAGTELQQAFKVARAGGVKNLRLLKTMADAMGKLVERQNELNRLSKLQSTGFERGRSLQERIDDLEQSRQVPTSRVKRLRGISTAVIDAANVGDAVKYAKALGVAEAAVRRQEKTLLRVEKAQRAVNTAQRALNKLKTSEFTDQKTFGSLQEKLNKVAQEAAKGNLVAAKRITKEVNEELQAQKDIVSQLKQQSVQRDRNNAKADRAAAKADREAKREKRKRETEARAQRQQRNRRLRDVATGVGFPLLFGGGPGAAVGGLLGGAIGGLGGSVLGSAVGQQLDRLGQAALDLGRAFQNVTKNAEEIIQALGTGAPRGFRGQAEFLSAQGFTAQVGRAATQEFENVYGTEALRKFEELSRVSREFDGVLTEVGVTLQQLTVGPLSAFLNVLKGLAGDRDPARSQGDRASRERFLQAADQDLPKIRELEKIKNKSFEQEQELARLQTQRLLNLSVAAQYEKEITASKGEQVSLDKITNQILQNRRDIQKAQTDVVRQELTARRDALAVLSAQPEILRLTAEEERLVTELDTERKINGNETARALQLQNDLIKVQGDLDRARLAQSNAQIKAQRAINREVVSNFKSAFQARASILAIDRQIQGLQESSVENYRNTTKFIEKEEQLNITLLKIQEKQELIGKNELEVINAITQKYEELINLERFRTKLRKEQSRQNELFRKDSEQQFKDQLNFQRAQEQINARQQIRAADPNRVGQFLGAGFGFFDESARLENELSQQRIEQTALYADQITDLTSRIEKLKAAEADPKRTETLEKELKQLEQTAETYSALQPKIDAVRVAQERYNEAFTLVSPAVNSLVSGLSEVVQGTKTAQEAFADFLRTIGDTLVQEGTRMIATYIAIGVAKAFAGLAGGGGPDPNSANVGSVLEGGGFTTGNLADAAAATPLANGGPARGGQPYMVGERGPELFVPSANGGVMRNEDMRQLMGRSPMGTSPQMNFTFETTNIGGQEFVSREQLEAAMVTTRRQAANDGAKRGMNMTLDKMQNSPRTRSRIGLR